MDYCKTHDMVIDPEFETCPLCAAETDEGSIQDLIRLHRIKWTRAGQWQDPNLGDCLDFMLTEVAEAIDKRLRLNPIYVRNNVAPEPSAMDIGIEVFDAILMGCVALDLLNLDLREVARTKLGQMDRKRGV
jgi:hypothetical protein